MHNQSVSSTRTLSSTERLVMDNQPPLPRKILKQQPLGAHPPHYLRHSVGSVSLAGSASSFGDAKTLSEEVEGKDNETHRVSGVRNASPGPERKLLVKADVDGEYEAPRRSHRSPILWAPEISVLAGGLLCLLAIAIILWRADGNPPPLWPLGTNLNTIVAFLASMAKVTFVVAVIEGLGQLKWMWFSSSQARPLSDFQVFDQASKGGWGSVKLLFRFKGFLATFGALILVTGLMTSTFTQMAITYPVVLAKADNGTQTATIERATGFSIYNGSQLEPTPFEAVREQQAVYEGGFYPPNEEAPHLSPVCSSGDCAWPAYGSLAICSEVVNLTAKGSPTLLANLKNVTTKRLETLYTTIESNAKAYGFDEFLHDALPGFYPVILGPMLSSSDVLNESVHSLIVNDNFIAYPNGLLNSSEPLDMDSFLFLGVSFWWCTKTFSSVVTSGEHTTTEIAARSERKAPSEKPANTETLNMAWSPEFYPCYTAGTCNETFGPAVVELEPPEHSPPNESYTVHVWTGLTVSGLLAATMWDSVLMDPTHGVVTSNGGGIAKAFALSILGDFMSATPPPATQLGNAKNVAVNIARSLTNLVRRESTHYASTTIPVVNGTVFTPQAFVRVHWGWVSVLSLQLGCASLFLFLVIVSTTRAQMQVLKSSSLATLTALRPEDRRELGGMLSIDHLEDNARKTKVRLERGASGLAVWLAVARSGENHETEQGWGDKKSNPEMVAKMGRSETGEFNQRRQGRVFEDYDTFYRPPVEYRRKDQPTGLPLTDDDD